MSNNQDHAVNKGATLARLGALCYVLWAWYITTPPTVFFSLPQPFQRLWCADVFSNAFYTAGLATISIIVGLWLELA